jgi:putative membrane protein
VRRAAFVLGFLGLALTTGLILSEGWRLVFEALALAGGGLFWAALFHVLPMALNARGFELLLPRGKGRTFPRFLWLVWIRESVDGLLPVGRVGGSLVSVRLMVRRGLPLDLSVASLVVDTTVSLGTQLGFLGLGLGLLAWRTHSWVVVRITLGALALVPILVAFVIVQKAGLFGLGARALGGLFKDRLSVLRGGARLDRAIHRLYRRRRALLGSALYQLLGWGAGAGEIFLAMFFLGHPLSLIDSLALTATIQAVSSAFFLVPAAVGVQEAGFMLLGPLLGVTPQVALTLALARRVRDIVLFVPGLVAFQLDEALPKRAGESLEETSHLLPDRWLHRSTRPAERRTSE